MQMRMQKKKNGMYMYIVYTSVTIGSCETFSLLGDHGRSDVTWQLMDNI